MRPMDLYWHVNWRITVLLENIQSVYTQDISSVFDQDPIAAETLLMVVNLPARTVVSIKLVDWYIFRIVGGVDKHPHQSRAMLPQKTNGVYQHHQLYGKYTHQPILLKQQFLQVN